MPGKTTLKRKIRILQKGEVGEKVRKRLLEFSKVQKMSQEQWFEELCFCILAANAKSQTSWNIQKTLGFKGFMTLGQEELARAIVSHKHRFHNTKARYIVTARSLHPLREKILSLMKEQGAIKTREWLAENVLGFGFKESSHYLRNIGFFDFAILDRHVLNIMAEYGILSQMAPGLSPKKYVVAEAEFQKLAKELDMSCAELDFYFWYMRAGDVLK